MEVVYLNTLRRICVLHKCSVDNLIRKEATFISMNLKMCKLKLYSLSTLPKFLAYPK